MIEREPLERHALKVYSLFVLYFLLTEGPMSGYELAQLIKERSRGHFRATAGNVYPRLHELKEAGDVSAGEPSKESRRSERGRSNGGSTSKTCSKLSMMCWPLLRLQNLFHKREHAHCLSDACCPITPAVRSASSRTFLVQGSPDSLIRPQP
jgi:hypothetical protein